ncbi:MAG: ankyrin repeat domain-containing protein [Parachlamydiales bacterium]|jgi:cytohesin
MNVTSISHYIENAAIFFTAPLEKLLVTIQDIREKILSAYNEPSKSIPELRLPPHNHPVRPENSHKNKERPTFLDNVLAKWDPFGFYKAYLEGAQTIETNENVTPLHILNLGKNYSAIYRYIANGADVNAQDIRGQSPAYWAAYHGNLKAMTILTSFGANIASEDLRQKTPLRAAAKYGHDDIITFLASHKVPLDSLDGRGLTPLHVAAYHKNFSAYQQLILHGADATIKDANGNTAEDLLKQRYAYDYHTSHFFQRLFSSPIPPPLIMSPWTLKKINGKAGS